MSVEITEVPIEIGMEQAPDDKDENKQIHDNTENTENNDTKINDENKQDDELIDDSKKKRGRPKGSLNKPKAKAKATESRAKAKKPEVTNDISDTLDTSDTLPAYIQQSPDYAMPQPQDLASQLFGLLQRHEHERTNRRRATYASWMTRF